MKKNICVALGIVIAIVLFLTVFSGQKYDYHSYYVSNDEQYSNCMYKEVKTELVNVSQLKEGNSYVYAANYNGENVIVNLVGEYNNKMFLHDMVSSSVAEIVMVLARLVASSVGFMISATVYVLWDYYTKNPKRRKESKYES